MRIENVSETYFSTIGEALGHVYRFLENGRSESNLTNVKNTLKSRSFDSKTVLMAVGWLAREDKIFFQKNLMHAQ